MSMKVALIGAGSLAFTRRLAHDVLCVEELQNTVFSLTDIDRRNLDMTAQLLRSDIQSAGLPAKVLASINRRKALADADCVVNCARVGGLEGLELDVRIPLKYGVAQCVGDTLCAGGIMYGQRGIPVMLDFCHDMRAVAKPSAILFNYANPNAMLTWAALQYGGVEAVGLCHGVQHGHQQIAELIELEINRGRKPGTAGYTPVTTREVDIVCAGINHQTWYIRVQYAGNDWTGRLLELFEKHPVYSKTEAVRIDMLRRFGYYSTESNGHLSEYVPWYRKNASEIRRWCAPGSWLNGGTCGYLKIAHKRRRTWEKDYQKLLRTPFKSGERSVEHFSYMLEGLATGRPYRGHFNVRNNGCIGNLPDDAVVEVPGYVDRNGIGIPQVGDLPLGCAAVCNASITVQRLAVEAAVRGDVKLLKQAMMMDPLTGAVCTPDRISQMVDEMLAAQKKWLPQYVARTRMKG